MENKIGDYDAYEDRARNARRDLPPPSEMHALGRDRRKIVFRQT
jgi:hypothetical protein